MYRNQSGFKKPFGGKPGSKTQGSDLVRWDHTGFEQLQKDNSRYKNEVSEKFGNNERNAIRDRGDEIGYSKDRESKNKGADCRDMWSHDKFVAEQSFSKQVETPSDVVLRKDKRPDMQLYKPKRGHNADSQHSRHPKTYSLKSTGQNEQINRGERDSVSIGDGDQTVKLNLEDKESGTNDDAISVVSNASTNVSDKGKGLEEKVEITRSETTNSNNENSTPVDEPESALILEVSLGADTRLRFFKGQYNYGQIINEFVAKHCVDEDLTYQLRIFIATRLRELIGSECKELEVYYEDIMEQYVLFVKRKGLDHGYEKEYVDFLNRFFRNGK